MKKDPRKVKATQPRPEESDVPQDDAVIGRAFRWSVAVFAAIAVVAGGIAVYVNRPKEVAPDKVKSLVLAKTRDRVEVEIPEIPFVDVTKEAGITFQHVNGAYGDKLLPETMGGGCAWFDFDQDGDADLFLVNSMYWPDHAPENAPPTTCALYRNDSPGSGKIKFVDVSEEAGLNVSLYGMGAAVGDFDDDGWVDLFITALGNNRLFHNEQGHFVDVSQSAGIQGPGHTWSTAASWVDYDNDQDLDLMVLNYVSWSKEFDIGKNCNHQGRRGYCRPDSFEGTFPFLYRNDGGGHFTNVAEQAGLQIRNPDRNVPLGKGLGLVPFDFDQDGWIDFFVANDTVQNLLFHNQKDGTFKEIGHRAGVAFDIKGVARGAMGADSANFRNDPTIGILVGNFALEESALYCSHGKQFTDDADATGLGPPTRAVLTFGVFFADMDNDTRLDIVHANGHLENEINKIVSTQHYEQEPQLFWNAGQKAKSEFVQTKVKQTGNDFVKRMVGRGASAADIDLDGDLDFVITGIAQAPRLLRNDQKLGHHWLRIKLKGTQANRDAIGATVEIPLQDKTIRRMVMPTRSYLSQFELPLSIGLGNTATISKLTVHWPGGGSQVLENVAADQSITIEQSTAAP